MVLLRVGFLLLSVVLVNSASAAVRLPIPLASFAEKAFGKHSELHSTKNAVAFEQILATSICAQRVQQIAHELTTDKRTQQALSLLSQVHGYSEMAGGIIYHYRVQLPDQDDEIPTLDPMEKSIELIFSPNKDMPEEDALILTINEDENGSCQPSLEDIRDNFRREALLDSKGIRKEDNPDLFNHEIMMLLANETASLDIEGQFPEEPSEVESFLDFEVNAALKKLKEPNQN